MEVIVRRHLQDTIVLAHNSMEDLLVNLVNKIRKLIIENIINTVQTDINPCTSNPCFNGGNCTVVGKNYTCACAPNFSGMNCQICNFIFKYVFFFIKYLILQNLKVNQCSNFPCLNGGNCTQNGNNFNCSCPTFYTGPTCQLCK